MAHCCINHCINLSTESRSILKTRHVKSEISYSYLHTYKLYKFTHTILHKLLLIIYTIKLYMYTHMIHMGFRHNISHSKMSLLMMNLTNVKTHMTSNVHEGGGQRNREGKREKETCCIINDLPGATRSIIKLCLHISAWIGLSFLVGGENRSDSLTLGREPPVRWVISLFVGMPWWRYRKCMHDSQYIIYIILYYRGEPQSSSFVLIVYGAIDDAEGIINHVAHKEAHCRCSSAVKKCLRKPANVNGCAASTVRFFLIFLPTWWVTRNRALKLEKRTV